MIVLDKPKLKFLLAGRTITVTTVRDHHRKGRSYAVGTAHNRPATCSVTVVGIRVTDTGRELDIIQVRADQPRLLARNPGAQRRDYVTHPHEAAEGEPEPVDAATVEKMSREAHGRHAERQQATRAATPLPDQIRDLERRAASGDQQAKRHLFMICKHLEQDAKRNARDAA